MFCLTPKSQFACVHIHTTCLDAVVQRLFIYKQLFSPLLVEKKHQKRKSNKQQK